MLLNARTGQRALYGLPMGQSMNNIHVWKSFLENAGLSLDHVPEGWERVLVVLVRPSPACGTQGIGPRRHLGHRPAHVGRGRRHHRPVPPVRRAYDADYVTRDGKLVIDDPEIRQRLVKAIDSYTAVYRKGCTPPDSVAWDDGGNNQAFLAQTVVMTTNLYALDPQRPEGRASRRLLQEHRDDRMATWPLGETFPIEGSIFQAVVFKDGGNVATAKEFVRFLVAEGWLMHYLNFSGEQLLPSIAALLDQPFWLDPSDRTTWPRRCRPSHAHWHYDYTAASGDLRHDQIYNERIWAKAIHRIVTEGITPEQAVDEAIARIKQILSE